MNTPAQMLSYDAMEERIRLDEVSVFGGKLSFLIPHDWDETSEEDHYMYCHPGTDSGWLRVSLITSKPLDETPARSLKRLFDGRKNVTQDKQTGNWIATHEKDSEEEGTKVHLYYWFVANIIQPDLVREAMFTYTVLADRVNDHETAKMVNLIGQIVSWANFSPEISGSTGPNS